MTRREVLQLAFSSVALAAQNSPGKIGPWRLGANTAISGLGFFEAVSLLRELQFPVIEIQAMGVLTPVAGRFPGFDFDRLSTTDKDSIRQALRAFQHVTIHLPYAGLHFFDANAEATAESLERLKYAMQAAEYFGCAVAVMHTTKPEGLDSAHVRDKMIGSFRKWGDIASKGRFRLAVETGTGGIDSAREFVDLLKKVDHPWVGCTLDVGHQSGYREFKGRVADAERATPAGRKAYNDLMHEIIDELGPKLFHFHVHDINPGTWKEHVPVGTGVIDYPRLIGKLRRTGYTGFFVLEIAAPNMREALADSKARMDAFLRNT